MRKIKEEGIVVSITKFGTLSDNRSVEKITISDGRCEVSILTLGAIIQSFKYKLSDGSIREIVSGSDYLESYVDDSTYKGQIVAPFANRIRNAAFILKDKKYNLEKNNGKNNLHSGSANCGYDVWNVLFHTPNGVVLNTSTKDLNGGFPGNIGVTVKYTLSNDTLSINYTMSSDCDCVINPTNHAYFNLNGENRDAREQSIMIDADRYTRTNDELIPLSVDLVDDDYDFRVMRKINEKRDGKYDTCYELNSGRAAILRGDDLEMVVTTDRPCLQLYTGEFFDSRLPRGNGKAFAALALETSAHVDSMNSGRAEEVMLKKGEIFRSITSYSLKELKNER